MKYFSEKLNKLFDSEKELKEAEYKNEVKIKAEKEKKEKDAAERKTQTAEVESARKAMVEARKAYADALEKFTKRWGSYHLSLTGEDAKCAIPTLFDSLFENWFDF